MSDFDKIKYNNSFNKEQYDRVSLMLPKGKKDIIKEFAKKKGESTNAFINRAIDEAIQRDVMYAVNPKITEAE